MAVGLASVSFPSQSPYCQHCCVAIQMRVSLRTLLDRVGEIVRLELTIVISPLGY